MDLLDKRGSAYKTASYDKFADLDRKINDLKNEHLEEFTKPVSAFVTMESEEGYSRACEVEKDIKIGPQIIKL